MLCCLLAVAQPLVTLEPPVSTVGTVLAQINAQVQTRWTAAPPLADLPIGVRLVGRTPTFVRTALAKALDGKWVGDTLTPDPALIRARDKARNDYFFAELDAAFGAFTDGKVKAPRLAQHPFHFSMSDRPEGEQILMPTELWEALSPATVRAMGFRKWILVLPPTEKLPFPQVYPDPEADEHSSPQPKVALKPPYGSLEFHMAKLDPVATEYAKAELSVHWDASKDLIAAMLRPDEIDPVHLGHGQGWAGWAKENKIESIRVFSDAYPWTRLALSPGGARPSTFNTPLLFHENLNGVVLAQETLRPWSIPRKAFRKWLERVHEQGAPTLSDYVEYFNMIPTGANGTIETTVRLFARGALPSSARVPRYLATLSPAHRELLLGGGTVSASQLSTDERSRLETLLLSQGRSKVERAFWENLLLRIEITRTPWVYGTSLEGGRISWSQEDFSRAGQPAAELQFGTKVAYRLFTHRSDSSIFFQFTHEDIVLNRPK